MNTVYSFQTIFKQKNYMFATAFGLIVSMFIYCMMLLRFQFIFQTKLNSIKLYYLPEYAFRSILYFLSPFPIDTFKSTGLRFKFSTKLNFRPAVPKY